MQAVGRLIDVLEVRLFRGARLPRGWIDGADAPVVRDDALELPARVVVADDLPELAELIAWAWAVTVTEQDGPVGEELRLERHEHALERVGMHPLGWQVAAVLSAVDAPPGAYEIVQTAG